MEQETQPFEAAIRTDDAIGTDADRRKPGRAALALSGVALLAGIAALAGLSTVTEAPPAPAPSLAQAQVDVPIAPPEPAAIPEADPEIAPAAPVPALFGSADAPPLRIMTFAACFEASACEEQTVPATTAALAPDALALWQGAPLDPAEEPARPPMAETPMSETPLAETLPAETPVAQTPTAESLAANTAPVMRTVPLPVRRPQEFRQALAREMARREARPVAVPMRNAAMPEAPVDNRSAFEKLFGVQQQPTSPAMAYAALDTQPAALAPTPARRALVPAPAPAPVAVVPAPAPLFAPRAGGGTAIYDISSKTVTLPSGERLEAHSGLGDAIDDPRRVHERMKGSTPPGTYDLTWRETSFHGVQALRMTPVGGSAAIHGRTGILAHHNLRGPSGESNGCVSFRNYERFRQAYARGEVSRLVVVPGGGANGVSNFVSRLFGGS